MELNIPKGLVHSRSIEVGPGDVEEFLGEIGIDVLSTTRLLHYMAYTSRDCIKPYLPENYISVGYYFEIYHVSPVRVGDYITITTKVIDTTSEDVVFDINVEHNGETVAVARHKRRIISIEEFAKKVFE